MAQIWLTYAEMVEAFGGSIQDARQSAIDNGWARIKGRDGIAHVRLTPAMAHGYLLQQYTHLHRLDHDELTDSMVAELRTVLLSACAVLPKRVKVSA